MKKCTQRALCVLSGMVFQTAVASDVSQPAPQVQAEPRQSLYRSSRIIGTPVRDLQGRKIGDIRDLILGSRRGDVAYAVISFGGVMGVGKTFHAVPWQALQARNGGRYYALNADRQTIRAAPSFDKARWPNMEDHGWRDEVDQYWSQMVG